MIVKQHISTDYHEVLPSDNISFTLDKMEKLYAKQLAVVNEGIYYGIIDESTLLNEIDTNLPISTLQHSFQVISILEDQHIYDTLPLISNHHIDLIPVLDKSNRYIGSLKPQNILRAINDILGNEESAIIVLSLEQKDYTLAHIAHIIESENTTIYNTAIQQTANSNDLELTIKLKKNNIAAVLDSLNRHGYVIKATFRDYTDLSKVKSNYNLLMNYLDM